MKAFCSALGALALLSAPALASTFDNESGRYVLDALPSADAEATRMDRMQLLDQQPAGRHVRKGETVIVTASDFPEDFYLAAMIGFRPMWGSTLGQQEQALDEGETRFVAEQSGPLYFAFITPDEASAKPGRVTLEVVGGQPLPLFVDGRMDADDWQAELAAHARAPFVQLLGERALITLPAAVHAQAPVDDPQETFAAISQVLDLQDDLAGFDGSSPRDRRSPLRQHYLVDFRVSEKDRENFYMYATDGFIGMLADNTADLTDPAALRQRWGIWHETGHTHQQHSWTWEALTEVNVNLFSLYVQETFGEESTLARSEDGEPSFLDKARDYLDGDVADLLSEVAEDHDKGFFIRLVMFHELKEAYGWDLFKDLHKHFRAQPLPEDASDQDKADAFVVAMCELTGVDLRPYFESWGLRASAQAEREINDRDYPPSDRIGAAGDTGAIPGRITLAGPGLADHSA